MENNRIQITHPLQYSLIQGGIYFWATFGYMDRCEGLVPKHIAAAGMLAVKKYAEEKIAEYQAALEEREEMRRLKLESLNVAFNIRFEKKRLGCRITSKFTTSFLPDICVSIEHPRKYAQSIWLTAVSQSDGFFDTLFQPTDKLLERAKKCVPYLYSEAVKQNTWPTLHSIVKGLNNENTT